jgi:cell fate regulator YaaT (PSP1 superfamily)
MYSVTVRYGVLRLINDFKTKLSDLKRGESVVVKTDRGTELGVVISPSNVMAVEESPVSSQNKTVQGENNENIQLSMGEVLRRVAPEDLKEVDSINREKIPKELEFCQKKVKDFNLQMKIISAENLLGGEKVIFYFLADGRIDFRDLVKELAKEYKTRIELRQIGVRDKARLLGDFEHCGQEICCRTFLKDLEPVTMKMAKQQKTMMDPSKISGRCSRLMCCLRFEDETYTELKQKLPRKGSRVSTKKGIGDIVDVNILSQEITIELEGGDKVKVNASEIIEVIKGPIHKVNETHEEE